MGVVSISLTSQSEVESHGHRVHLKQKGKLCTSCRCFFTAMTSWKHARKKGRPLRPASNPYRSRLSEGTQDYADGDTTKARTIAQTAGQNRKGSYDY